MTTNKIKKKYNLKNLYNSIGFDGLINVLKQEGLELSQIVEILDELGVKINLQKKDN